MQTLMRVG